MSEEFMLLMNSSGPPAASPIKAPKTLPFNVISFYFLQKLSFSVEKVYLPNHSDIIPQ